LTEDKDHTLRGSSVLAALKEASVGTVITVPDITTSEGLLRPIAADQDLRHIQVCKEDEGVGISAGLSFCGERSVLLIQNTGLLDSINAIRAVGVEYELPISMLSRMGSTIRTPQFSESVGAMPGKKGEERTMAQYG
jgi:sulfopyruvate decarboxylase TPP-binding subunit